MLWCCVSGASLCFAVATVDCEPGQQLEYSVTGTPFCVQCAPGKVRPLRNYTSLTLSGFVSLFLLPAALPLLASSFLEPAGSFNLDGKECLPCPFGAQCDGGTHIAGAVPVPLDLPLAVLFHLLHVQHGVDFGKAA